MSIDTELRICQADGCLEPLTGRQRKYHSHSCSARESYRRRAGLSSFTDKYRDLEADDKFLRRGDLYEILGTHPVADQILAGEITIGAGAELLGVDRTAMTRALAAVVVDRRTAAGQIPMLSPNDALKLLGPPDYEIPDPGTPEYEVFLDELVVAFITFRNKFFVAKKVGELILRFVNKGYHRKWIRSILNAIFVGGQQMVLSPPRHGKTELLIHFCVWLIVRNPDIMIMWIAKNEEMAEDMVGAVKDHLTNNKELIEAFLGPDGRWRPKRGGWGRLKFRVANRTVVGQKAATMVGVGWTGTILSRDVDVIILDDVLDDRNTLTAGMREANRVKLVTAVDSRKESHTAFFIIGSRQHWDDFYGYLIDDPEWDTIIEQAHSDDCELDPHVLEIHTECMLWHERHPYTWWYKKWQSQKRMQLEHLFEMIYQNRPRPTSRIVYPKDALLGSRNFVRAAGDLAPFTNKDGSPMRYQLVAGLDPSAVGHQAVWLWLYHFKNQKRYMLDAGNPLGGGVEQFIEMMIDWHKKYELRHWVVETVGIQRVFIGDQRVRETAARLGIAVDGHQTGYNRLDKEYGVPAMAHWFIEDLVDLPYGDDRSKELTDTFIRQALNFDPDIAGKVRRPTSDLLMAAWFPMTTLQALMIQRSDTADLDYEPMFASYDVSTYEDAPW